MYNPVPADSGTLLAGTLAPMAAPRPGLRRRGLLILAVLASVGVGVGAVAPWAVPNPEPERPAFGVQYHGLWSGWEDDERTEVLDKVAESGATWVRMDVGWINLQPDGGDQLAGWYLDRMNRWVDAARDRGLEVLVTLWATPGWANGGAAREEPPHDPADYGRVAERLAREFRGRVSAWEVWNEPNDPDFYDGSAEDYAALLDVAYPAFKAGDSEATVVLGGPSYNDTPWLAEVYEAGAAGSFDVLSTHPYLRPSDLGPDTADDGTIYTLAHVDAVRVLMVAHGDEDLPIWFTEFGWSSHEVLSDAPWDQGVTEQEQADYLVETLRLIREDYPWVTHAFWYAAVDRAGEDAELSRFGLLTRDLEEKPAYWAVREELQG